MFEANEVFKSSYANHESDERQRFLDMLAEEPEEPRQSILSDGDQLRMDSHLEKRSKSQIDFY